MSIQKKKVVFITGAGRGTGKGIAEIFLESDYNVFTVGRTLATLQKTEKYFYEKYKRSIKYCVCDVGVPVQVEAAVNECIEIFQQIDILINNSCNRIHGGIEDISIEDWQQSINTNVNGYFYLVKFCLKYIKKSENPWVINIGSTAGRVPFQNGLAYNTAKAAVHLFSESLLLDLRKYKIRVCAVIPNNIWNKESACPTEEEWMLKPENIGEAIMKIIKLKSNVLPTSIELRATEIPNNPEAGIRSLRYL